jgi:hypothetical protein
VRAGRLTGVHGDMQARVAGACEGGRERRAGNARLVSGKVDAAPDVACFEDGVDLLHG